MECDALERPYLSPPSRRRKDACMADEVIFDDAVPVIRVRDLDAAIDRYGRLGFSVRRYPGDARYAFADRGGASLHLSELADHDPPPASVVYLYVSDADALFTEWSERGIEGHLHEPFDTDYGLREFVFVDSDGTRHRVGSRLSRDSA